MTIVNLRMAGVAAIVFSAGIMICAGNFEGKLALAQAAPSQPSAAQANEIPVDQYNRTAQLWFYQRMGKSGWERGQEIYKMKCWICHNDYTITAEPTGAPTLRGLFKRPTLKSGQPVNDKTVINQILYGSARMAGYRPVLTDQDIADLLIYLKEKCCWDEMNPPANPRYHP
jgi:mono/diheme cytochrome c family protein